MGIFYTEKHEKGPKRTVVIDIDGGRPISRVLPEEKYQGEVNKLHTNTCKSFKQ